ncbi:MAG: branched-chain amino acid ABC transporter permease [Halapricum sp.]
MIDTVVLAFTDSLVKFVQPTELFEVFVNGLSKASLYVMIASGLTLIFGLLGVLNFAHGSLTMIGAYLGGAVMVMTVSTSTGPWMRLAFFFVGLAVVFGVLTGIGGALEVGLIRKLYDRPPIYQILLTFGLTLIIDELMRIILQFYDLQPMSDWQQALGTKPAFLTETLSLGPLSAQGLALFEILMGLLTVIGIWAFLTRTRYGLFIRAGSEDDEMAAALGIDVRQVFTVVFALGIGVAGAAGMLLMWDSLWAASVPLGAETLLPAFVVVIVGGLGTFRGTVVAALLVGMTDAVMTWWFVHEIRFSGLPELTIFLILVGVLIVRPQGLYGVEGVGGH